ncbi:hypothetical protein TNCV_1990081 [Trichonephila clavipes]|nr:hypothetical protein TNCV_1990081 [Trichonephila clavipes]
MTAGRCLLFRGEQCHTHNLTSPDSRGWQSVGLNFLRSRRAVKMGPGKRMKHSTGFKIKVIQFVQENGNRTAARMFDIGENSIRK